LVAAAEVHRQSLVAVRNLAVGHSLVAEVHNLVAEVHSLDVAGDHTPGLAGAQVKHSLVAEGGSAEGAAVGNPGMVRESNLAVGVVRSFAVAVGRAGVGTVGAGEVGHRRLEEGERPVVGSKAVAGKSYSVEDKTWLTKIYATTRREFVRM